MDNSTQLDASVHPLCWALSCPTHFGLCPYRTTLSLQKKTARREDVGVCGGRTSELPYDKLGSIETTRFCCFVCVDSNIGTFMPGFGCSVNEAQIISQALQERVQQSTLLEGKREAVSNEMIDEKIALINEKLEMISNHISSTSEPTLLVMHDRDS